MTISYLGKWHWKYKGKSEILEPNNEAKTPSKTQVVSGTYREEK